MDGACSAGWERLAAAGTTRARDPSSRGAVLLPGVSGREAARVGQGCVLVGSDVTRLYDDVKAGNVRLRKRGEARGWTDHPLA
ncbi:hypothetical protein K0M31_015165 [Melipona bicolor]|uniref:Uncharacterized protein n=1 Tax=Melipona bicolor TaxID=60889 RepID=A0AA40FGB3_9HYME|nr:hypothetical protein K0M31_015165 [Melipona bicolor]